MPIHIKVLLFAALAERVGVGELALELPAGATVGQAIDQLAGQHDAIAVMRDRLATAVDLEYVGADHVLRDGDELALIPPVAGGAPDRLARVIADRPPSLDVCVAAVTGPDTGAVVTFVGMVRRHNRGREVERLHYEAYEQMANRVLAELCTAIEAEVAGARLAVEHRVGDLVTGDVAVVIAAAAPHRAEAFTACRELIERLKQDVPIWKKEITTDGAEWLGIGP